MLIVLLQLFWFSFFLFGAAVLLWLSNKRWASLLRSNCFVAALPVPALAFTALCAALVAAAPLVAIAYFVELPVLAAVCVYIVALIVCLSYLVLQRRRLWQAVKRRLPATKLSWLVATVVIASLGLDYIVALHAKGLLDMDAAVHIARINFIANGGFSLADPYFSRHGLIDPRYSTNLLLGLSAVAAKLLHHTALWVWLYSVAFYRFVLWLSVFFLCWQLFGAKIRQRWAYLFLILAPLLLGSFYFNAEFPDRIVLAWVALFIGGLRVFMDTDSPMLLLGGSILIAVTHPVDSLMALGFLLLMAFVLLIIKRLTARRSLWLLLNVAVLSLPVLLNLAYPDRTHLSKAAFNAGAISGSQFIPHHYGWLYISALPQHLYVGELLLSLLVPVILFISTHGHTRFVKRTFFGLGSIVALLAYYPAYLSLLGYFVIAKHLKSLESRLIIVLLVLYYGLIVYNPLVVTLVAGRVPPWIVARFQELNLFGLIAPYIAIFAWVEFPRQHLKDRQLTALLCLFVIPIYLFIVPTIFPVAPPSLTSAELDHGKNTPDALNIKLASTLEQLSPVLRNQTVYSDDNDDDTIQTDDVSFYVPAVVPGANVITTLDTNYSPMSNIPARDTCGKLLGTKLAASDLRAAGVTRVIAYRGSALSKLAGKQLYLHLLKQANGYQVYAVKLPVLTSRPAASRCAIPYGQ